MLQLTRREYLQLAAACGLSGPQLAGAWVAEQAGVRLKEAAPPVRYILRIFFPNNQDVEQRTKALVNFCQQTHIQHVSIFHSTGGHGLQPLPEARVRVSFFERAFAMLRQAGISPGINVLGTIGHGDWIGPRSGERDHPFQWMVGHDGTQTESVACPLDKSWREYVRELYRIYASLQPEFIYIDDDFRYHAHYPAIFTCFCPLHLEAMGGLLGRKVTREELLERILLATPQPTRERLEWYRLLSDSLVDVARMLTREVHAISPETRMGLMTSKWTVHAVEGRDWKALLAAVGEFHRPRLRLHMTQHIEGPPGDLAAYLGVMRGPLTVTQATAQITPEWDFPSSPFAASLQILRFHAAISFLHRIPDIMPGLNFNFEEPVYGEMLRKSYPYFQGLLNLAWNCPEKKGVQIAWSADRPVLRRTVPDDPLRAREDCWGTLMVGAWTAKETSGPQPCRPIPNPCALVARDCWEGTLERMGFSTVYTSAKAVALGGEEAMERSDEELKAFCSDGLLLDAGAAREIARRGFQSWIGIFSVEPLVGANGEEIIDREFGGRYYGQLIGQPPTPTRRRLTVLPEAKTITRLLGGEESSASPGMVLYKNSLGGRICTLPFEGGGALKARTFANWEREYLFLRVLEWLFGGPVPLFISDAANVYPFRRDGPEGSMVAIANLSSDEISDLRWQMVAQRKPNEILLLQKDGNLRRVTPELSLKGGYLHLALKHSIPTLDLACFFVSGI